MFKGLGILALLLFAGGYFTGAFGPQSYSRTVARPQAQVMSALEQLDLTAQPGAPGSTAEAAGGIKPLFRLAKTADQMTWYVMSGDKVATTMTASFEPIDGGKATRISTRVQRGDAPDDFVSPAFRSKGLTTALFAIAIEGEVNKLVAPPAASRESCDKLMDNFRDSNLTAGIDRPAGLSQGVAAGAKTIMRLNAMEAEMRRNGCDTNNNGAFPPMRQQMAAQDAGSNSGGAASMSGAASTYTPGKPMLDPKPSR